MPGVPLLARWKEWSTMRISPLVIAAVLVVVLAGSAAELAAQRPVAWVVAQVDQTRQDSGEPFSRLLGHRTELQLTAEQVEKIRAIQQMLLRRNEPLLAQIRDSEVWGVDSDEEAAAIAAVRVSFGQNAVAAEQEVEEVLTSEQVEEARALLEGASLAYAVQEGGDVTGREPTSADDQIESSAEDPSTSLTVENFNFYDANIYVHRGARRHRLGFSTGLTTRTFVLPAWIVVGSADLYFEVRPIGRSQFPISEFVTVHPGDDVFLRIPPQ
jgi:hypothetical protein